MHRIGSMQCDVANKTLEDRNNKIKNIVHTHTQTCDPVYSIVIRHICWVWQKYRQNIFYSLFTFYLVCSTCFERVFRNSVCTRMSGALFHHSISMCTFVISCTVSLPHFRSLRAVLSCRSCWSLFIQSVRLLRYCIWCVCVLLFFFTHFIGSINATIGAIAD